MRGRLVNAALVAVSLLAALWLAEQVMAWRHAADPLTEVRKRDRELRLRSHRFAKQHPFGFTDLVRTEARAPGAYRIAVLGDSFIWGSGIPHEDVWSHRLEERLRERYANVEVLSWGRNGWSTLDQLAFLDEHGRAFEFDWLIVGLVENDPDIGRFARINADARLRWIDENLALPRRWFPRVTRLAGGAWLDRVHGTQNDEYQRWLDDLYTPENLVIYAEVLRDLAALARELEVGLTVAMTPSNRFEGRTANAFAKLEPLVRNAGIDVLNLLPAARERFDGYADTLLRASPVNGHPGPVMTQFFADQVATYLVEKPGLVAGLQPRP